MNEARAPEVPLGPDEVRRILALCSPDGLLVGGQALAFWADHLEVALPPALASGVTADIDFIADAHLAREVGRRLAWKTWIPTLDEATPQTGKVTQALPGGGVKQIDFLSSVAGLTTKDLEKRAALLEIPGIGSLRVIHPIDVLDSRIQNLDLLAEKRTAAGIAQARLAVGVARRYIGREIVERGERAAFKLAERVAAIAEEIAAVRVFLRYGIDPLEAVPIDEFRTTPALQSRRWPQTVAAVAEKRDIVRGAQAKKEGRL